MKLVHSRRVQVVLGDTDAAQVIFYPTVFRWHEYSLSEWLAAKYMPLTRIFASGFGLPVVKCSATYPASIRQDDIVVLESWVAGVGESSFTFGTTVLHGDTIAATVETRHVWVRTSSDGSFASQKLPAGLREELAGQL